MVLFLILSVSIRIMCNCYVTLFHYIQLRYINAKSSTAWNGLESASVDSMLCIATQAASAHEKNKTEYSLRTKQTLQSGIYLSQMNRDVTGCFGLLIWIEFLTKHIVIRNSIVLRYTMDNWSGLWRCIGNDLIVDDKDWLQF